MRSIKRPYVAGFVLVGVIIVVANILHFLRPVTCADCFFPYGLPFTIYQDGGFAGGAGYLRTGIIGDIAVFIVGSLAMGAILSLLRVRS